MIIDTHAHLNSSDYDDDLDLVIKRAIDNKVFKMIIVGFDKKTNLRALELAKKHDNLYPTVGIHPTDVNNIDDNDLKLLEKQIVNNKVYAVGECGLDYYWIKDNKKKQIDVFEKQIALSIKYDLPLVIHMREASNDMYKILKKYKGKIKGVMHGYSGSLETMNQFIELGMHIALGGPVTFKRAIMPKTIAKHVPLNRLLLETDCPYLTPQKHRGKRNEPSYLSLICQDIASLKELPYDIIAEKTTKNAISLFKLEE